MVRAILEGRKTVTRRLVKPQPPVGTERFAVVALCPPTPTKAVDWLPVVDGATDYGAAPLRQLATRGDRLWVRETWARVNDCPDFQESGRGQGSCGCEEDHTHVIYRATDDAGPYEWQDDSGKMHPMIWRPSIYMPRGASRITLEVVTLRVERLQDITEDDAKAEGAQPKDLRPMGLERASVGPGPGENSRRTAETHPFTIAFAMLWDSINAERATWQSNPWVWRVEFKRVST
jgi:hypothetical protein